MITPKTDSPWRVFCIFLRLGLTSFGGPVAHLACFREEFVQRRQWLGESAYADLVALCQFLPGPASSQVGMALGLMRAGQPGLMAAWLGFTLPSALLLTLFAFGLVQHGNLMNAGLLHGLKIVAAAVVAQAVWSMARSLCPDWVRRGLMLAAALVATLLPGLGGQLAVIAAAAIAGLYLQPAATLPASTASGTRPHGGLPWLLLFFTLFFMLPLAATWLASPLLQTASAFYTTGSLVFGGGHVVLPLLETQVVASGQVNGELFLAGYGLAQAVPGPLFSFAAFLGALMPPPLTGWSGAILCLLALYLPSWLLVSGSLPYWQHLRRNTSAQHALAGINAAVVGLLLAALYRPVLTSTLLAPTDLLWLALALAALMRYRLPPWLLVPAGGLLGWWLQG